MSAPDPMPELGRGALAYVVAIILVLSAAFIFGGCTTSEFTEPEILTGTDQVVIEDDMAGSDMRPRCCSNRSLPCWTPTCPYL